MLPLHQPPPCAIHTATLTLGCFFNVFQYSDAITSHKASCVFTASLSLPRVHLKNTLHYTTIRHACFKANMDILHKIVGLFSKNSHFYFSEALTEVRNIFFCH